MIFRRHVPDPPPPPTTNVELAAAFLFTAEPTDRALAGWNDWAAVALEGMDDYLAAHRGGG